jgi:ATP-dependent 26S proteasome regulatory subunit
MTLSDDVNLEEFVMTKDEFSGADIKAICTESGLLALRERRMKVWLDILSFKLGELLVHNGIITV